MKKIFKSLLAIFLLLVFVNSASAVEMTVSEIEEQYAQKGYYIIGSFLFTRTAGEEQYSGTLTTHYIMKAAQSVTGRDLSNMKVYYKTSKNEYIDAVTLETVTFPSTFQIDYVNMRRISPYYGDLDQNGTIDMADVKLLDAYLEDSNLPVKDLDDYDINDDGDVDSVDLVLLKGFVSGYYPNTLPNTKITDYVLYGDVSGNDGKITSKDLADLTQYLEDKTSVTIDLVAADINQDGKVDEKDQVILSAYLAEWNIATKLPYEKATEKAYIITMYHGSQEIGKIGTLEGYSDLPSAEEVGYVFDGWYSDASLTNKIDGNSKLTTDVNVYGKFIQNAFGDVNCDGNINDEDEALLKKYIKGQTQLTTKGLENADVNGDGKVNSKDLTLLQGFLKGYYQNTLPKKQMTDAKIIGAVNDDGVVSSRDGVILAQVLSDIISVVDMDVWDVNDDGIIDQRDAIVLERYAAEWSGYLNVPYEYCTEKIWKVEIYVSRDLLETQYIDNNCDVEDLTKIVPGKKLVGLYTDENLTKEWTSSSKVTSDLKLYAKYEEVATNEYGDLNNDGSVSSSDLVILVEYIDAPERNELSNVQATRADLNCDGKVDIIDLIILNRYLASWPGYESLPYTSNVLIDNDNLL